MIRRTRRIDTGAPRATMRSHQYGCLNKLIDIDIDPSVYLSVLYKYCYRSRCRAKNRTLCIEFV